MTYHEKEVLNIAARSTERDDSPISRDDYRNEVVRLEQLRHEKRKKELERRLPLGQRDWVLLDILRLLANSYKHDPFDKRSKHLLKRLGLPDNVNYARLPESGAVWFGLSKFLMLVMKPGPLRS